MAISDARSDEYADIRDTIAICDSCHGKNGASTDDAFPVLAGQELHYSYVQLKDFKSGLRKNDIMSPIIANLEKPVLLQLAKYYSEQQWPNIGYKGNPARMAQGRTATDAGQCVACHLGSFTGNSRIPRLAGQHPNYLEKTMQDLKTKARGNAAAMSSLMASFSDDDIAAMAEFLGGM